MVDLEKLKTLAESAKHRKETKDTLTLAINEIASLRARVAELEARDKIAHELISYVMGAEEYDTAVKDGDCIYVQHFKGLISLNKELESGGWISVDDRLPENVHIKNLTVGHSKAVLGYVTDNLCTFCVSYDYERKAWRYFDDCRAIVWHEITHWQPLPEPPKEQP